MPSPSSNYTQWPVLPFDDIKNTCTTLHLWTQIVGKIRLVQTPWTNHSWHVPLYLTSNGLTTSPIPHKQTIFEIRFDFLQQALIIERIDGQKSTIPLEAQPTSAFYHEIMKQLNDLGIPVNIYTTPSEIPNAIPFDKDDEPREYDQYWAKQFWLTLMQADRVFKEFRSRFIGKCSPVHFFWGSFDLAVTRFSGREAPPHPGGIPNFPDWVAQEAYSHEVSSAGFWPGGSGIEYPLFYSYAYPAAEEFKDVRISTPGALYSQELGEFILPYPNLLKSKDPDRLLMGFLQETYEAAAVTAGWDRTKLEKEFGPA